MARQVITEDAAPFGGGNPTYGILGNPSKVQQLIDMANEHASALDASSPSPFRVLHVSPTWPANANSLVFFPTIATALAQAATMSPALTNPVHIFVWPGTYSDNLTLVSNVFITGTDLGICKITGTMTWTPGAGINAGQVTGTEQFDFNSMSMATSQLTIDSTAKPLVVGNAVALILNGVTLGGLNWTGRSGLPLGGNPSADELLIRSSNLFKLNWTLTSVGGTIFGCRHRGITFAGNSLIALSGNQFFQPTAAPTPVVLSGTANITMAATELNYNINVGPGTTLRLPGSVQLSGCTITTSLGGITDARDCNVIPSQLTGAGAYILRTMRGTTGSTSTGANAITLPFTLPAADTSYTVTTSQISGTATAVTVSAKTNTGFTLNDPSAGGNTFEYVVTHD